MSFKRGSTVVSEPDPWKNRKEGLGDRPGQKCAVCPECRHASNWFMNKPQPASIVQEKLLEQLSPYWANGWLEVPEIKV